MATMQFSKQLGMVSIPPKPMTAVVQVAGDWTTVCEAEPGADDGWYLLYGPDAEEAPTFIYNGNTGDLVRGNGEPIPYGTFCLEWV